MKIDSNPFAKGFRDSSRLSDLERESIEQMIKETGPGSNSGGGGGGGGSCATPTTSYPFGLDSNPPSVGYPGPYSQSTNAPNGTLYKNLLTNFEN